MRHKLTIATLAALSLFAISNAATAQNNFNLRLGPQNNYDCEDDWPFRSRYNCRYGSFNQRQHTNGIYFGFGMGAMQPIYACRTETTGYRNVWNKTKKKWVKVAVKRRVCR